MRSHAVLTGILVIAALITSAPSASAQNPRYQGNQVFFVGSWAITAGQGAGDGDDYWFIFFRPGRSTYWLNVDEEDIKGQGDWRIQETGEWRVALTVQDEPRGCDANPVTCHPVTVRYLRPDGSNDNRWFLGLRTHDDQSDLDLRLDRIVPTLEVTSPNPNFGDVPIGDTRFGFVGQEQQ
jgi:hypothetical protein